MEKGEEYEVPGETPGWLKNDLFKELFEELADCTNWSMLLFIRLRIIQERLRANGVDLSTSLESSVSGSGLPSGAGTFIPTAELPDFLSASPWAQDPG